MLKQDKKSSASPTLQDSPQRQESRELPRSQEKEQSIGMRRAKPPQFQRITDNQDIRDSGILLGPLNPSPAVSGADWKVESNVLEEKQLFQKRSLSNKQLEGDKNAKLSRNGRASLRSDIAAKELLKEAGPPKVYEDERSSKVAVKYNSTSATPNCPKRPEIQIINTGGDVVDQMINIDLPEVEE